MSRQEWLLESINDFYTDDTHMNILKNLLNRKCDISLRSIEWFITNYSKKRNTMITNEEGKTFAVHCAYKSSLDGYSKKFFDPFCRLNKIRYTLKNGEQIQTTVAQLNFVKWCIKNNIIAYIKDNRENLMSEYIK